VNQLVAAAGMALLAMASVGLWTLRVALTARGRKGLAAAVASLEAVVFAVAFTNITGHLDSPARIVGYAAGVAIGTVLGLTVDHHASPGVAEVNIVVPAHEAPAVERLRNLGWPATSFPGNGPSGPITLIYVAVDDSRVAELTAALQQVTPSAFWTIQRLGGVHASALPERYLQVTR
jgi:uncharacterized protein YebE (UPF0316 family)